MTVTFNPDLSTPIDRVRFRLGDTDINTAQVQNESIQYYLDQNLSELMAASKVAASLAARYARLADFNVDDQMTKVSTLFEHFRKLSIDLANEAAEAPTPNSNPAAFGGGIINTGIGDCRGFLHGDCTWWPSC